MAKIVSDEIEFSGLSAKSFGCDISPWDKVNVTIDEILLQFGEIDILVNNAGLWESIPFAETLPKEWDRQIRANYYGTLHCTRTVLDKMIGQGYGRVINIISDAGRRLCYDLISSHEAIVRTGHPHGA